MKTIINRKSLVRRLKEAKDVDFIVGDELKFLLYCVEHFETISRDAQRYRKFKEIVYDKKQGLSAIDAFDSELMDDILDRELRKKVV